MMDPLTTELALNISKAIRDDAFSLIFQKSDRDYDGFVTLKDYYQSCAKIIDRAWIEPEKEKREYRRFLAWFSQETFQSYQYNSYHMKTLLSFENLVWNSQFDRKLNYNHFVDFLCRSEVAHSRALIRPHDKGEFEKLVKFNVGFNLYRWQWFAGGWRVRKLGKRGSKSAEENDGIR